MAEDSDAERTEPASGRKLQEARDKGNIPRSRELATFAVLIASTAVMALGGPYMLNQLLAMFKHTLSFDYIQMSQQDVMLRYLSSAGMDGVWALVPLFGVVAVAAVASNLLISGWNFTFTPLEPNFSKMNPLTGIKRMFSMNSLAELFKAIMKSGVIAGAAIWAIWLQYDEMLVLSSEALEIALPHFGQIVLITFITAAAAYVLVAAVDVPYQIWNYGKQMRMTKEEVRQEAKQTEGDPQIKARIRGMQREQARRRMMSAVPKADVVVTNPLHFAVALKYEDRKMSAPIVVAKGSQLVAERIKELARENRVPIVEAPPLARALHRHVEIGDVIPGSLFTAVAQVLAYVYQLNNHLNPSLPDQWDIPEGMDPGVAPA